METILAVTACALIASLVANGVQVRRIKEARKRPAPTLTAEELLHDLTRRGYAVLKVEVIDADNLFLRSPRA